MSGATRSTARPFLAATLSLVAAIAPLARAQRFPEDRRNESTLPNSSRTASALAVQVLPAPGEKSLPPLVVVELEGLTGGNTRVQWVQGDGVARFEEVAGGSYTIRARAEEYQDVEQTLFIPPALRGRSTVSLTLGARRGEGRAPEPPASAGSVVSVEKLQIPAAASREFRKGLAESGKGRPERAAVHLEKALRNHPRYVDALTLLGEQYVRLRRLADAARAYQRAVELAPQHAAAHFNLGLVALEPRDLPEARLHLIRTTQLDPAGTAAFFYRLLSRICGLPPGICGLPPAPAMRQACGTERLRRL